MRDQHIGKNRADNLQWLATTWLKDGPPVCFLQGFSGVGKTCLARDFRNLASEQSTCQGAVLYEITDRATPDVRESFMEISSALSQMGFPEMEEVLFNQSNPNLALALEKILRRPVVIIIDEAQRLFHVTSGKPLPAVDDIFRFLGNRMKLPGRLLLLSDRTVEWSHGSEWIPKRTLRKLEPDEALETLDTKMKEAGVGTEIPFERKKDIVHALDYNPRAIEALVGALFRDALDDIIQSDPGLWAVEDREVSRDFIRELEHRLLERTLRHLDNVHLRQLWRLAVHRRSFKREALERVCGTKDEVSQLRSILETRFLLNFYKGVLALNPIVREIALAHLRDDPAEFRKAHSGAADYHMRHFTAKQIVASQDKLGDSFAELRYHLVQADRTAELSVIGRRFTDHLKQEIHSSSPVPANAEELNERIGVLTVLLGSGGATGLEYHLARCLQSRGKAGDLQQATIHAERAVGYAAPEAWYLLANLKRQAQGLDAAITVVRRGIRELKNPGLTAPLYQLGAEILSGANKTDQAVVLLKEGIKVIPPDKSLSSLYQIGADLLAKVGETDEAVELLKEGIKVIPPDKSLASLYQIGADLLAKAGKTYDAVALLKEGIKVIPPDKSLFALYQISADLLAKVGKTDEAVALLKEGIKVIPPDKSLHSLYQISADLLAKVGKTDDAVALLKEGIKVIPPDFGLSSLYFSYSEVFCRIGQANLAIQCLVDGFLRVPEKFGGHKLLEAATFISVGTEQLEMVKTRLSGIDLSKVHRASLLLLRVLELVDSLDFEAALEVASDAGKEWPRYGALALQEAFLRLVLGDFEGASKAIFRVNNTPQKVGAPILWLSALVDLRSGRMDQATRSLTAYLGRPVNQGDELTESFLFRLWDEPEMTPESHRLCFNFPILPASLTALPCTVRRSQFEEPVLPSQVAAPLPLLTVAPAIEFPPLSPDEPDVYVSYAWGDDESADGIKREEIVIRMCDALARTGRIVGRDRTVMKPGDSIEAFADRIAKAPRIVAVISQKSLHSKFCMVDEIYSAYQRSGFQRAEFQSKVIALVMDDATALLKDDIGLVKHWKALYEHERGDLQEVDPNKKSLARWGKVHKLGDMCDHLLDMIDAIRDIVMPRGYENIVKGNFDEVISRLPSKRT